MRNYTQAIRVLLVVFAGFFCQNAISQTGVLDPNDPIVVYDANNPPATPKSGTMAKWVKTNRLSWNTSSYKSYFYKGIAFRLKFPKTYQHNVNDGKTYPLFIFFHGKGEKGTIYDNEYQLYHGGELHKNAVDNGSFDGFLLYPQIQVDAWGTSAYAVVKEIVDKYLVPQVKVDPYRVIVDGLSAGGSGSWGYTIAYPMGVAACLPISASSTTYISSVDKLKFIPIWHFQGGLDQAPTPYTSEKLGDALLAAGANYRYTKYPDQGHGCWYSAWGEADYFPYMSRQSKLNPWPLFGRTEFCPGDAINITIGVTAGFTSYEWRKNGNVIPGANSNTLNVTDLGTYDCRILNGSTWSGWSPTPVVIKLKAATVSPNIQVSGLASKVIPVPDGNAGVKLEVPAGYTSYNWQRDGENTTLSTTRFVNATTPGNYKVKVTELYGCSSDFSSLFKVIDANGANKPDAANNVLATTVSKTAIRLDWNQNANPAYNETNFEIYQSNSASGGYKLVALTNQDASTYTATGLNAGKTYYFIIRAVNNEAASASTTPVSATTLVDNVAPTAPVLSKGGVTQNSVELTWDASSDDVGVTGYDIYVNGVKNYTTTATSFTVYNLTFNKTYNFTVKARDFAGNTSLPSNQVTATASLKGLTFKYYQDAWNTLPDFNKLTPVASGVTANVTIDSRLEDDNFGYLWEGTIKIPVAGTYTFRTNSDDGSRLYLGPLNGNTSPYSYTATPVVDNDGLHGSQDRDGTITLAAGYYPIAITFFEKGGGQNINVSWKIPSAGSFTALPDSVFTDGGAPAGVAPSAPSAVIANALSSKKISLSWTDNSNNETLFEIHRSTSSGGPFALVGTVGSNVTSFTDSTCAPATTYYYRVKAVGKFGESDFNDGGNSLKYAYYETIQYSALPDFNTLNPTKTGVTNNFIFQSFTREDDFAYKYDGVVVVPTSGNYTFYTSSDDGSKLYLDGTTEASLVVNNDGLHGMQERSGTKFLTAGVHSIRVTFFERGGGQALEVRYQGPGIPKQLIPDAALHIPPVSATTAAIAGAPTAPSGLAVNAASTSKNSLSWVDNSDNETAFEVYRSINNNSNYLLIATLAPNEATLVDSNLTSNTKYYYKVRALNEAGASAYTDEAFTTTLNNTPIITNLSNKLMRYGTQVQIDINASDPDNENLSIVASNLPAFASYVATGNGTGVLSISPQITDIGVYNNISFVVNDEHGGTASTSFNLTVNDNYAPVITGTTTINLSEGSTATLQLVATDQNDGDVLSWSIPNLPAFITQNVNGNTLTLQLKPGFSDADVYNFTATVDDGKGGQDIKNISITVSDANPNKKIYINVNNATTSDQGAPWNNISGVPAVNKTIPNLKDSDGNSTGISFVLPEKWAGSSEYGYNTGNNSGLYPDNVMKSQYYETANTPRHIRLNGLSTTDKYNLTFYASRMGVSDNRTTTYTVGNQSVSLNPAGNQSNTVTLQNLISSNGQIEVTITRGEGSAWEYINAMVIEKVFDDGSTPATPKDLTISYANGIGVLTWRDVAFNESSYEVYRSNTVNGNYTLLSSNSLGTDASGFNDSSLVANNTYYYKVRAVNQYGPSAFTGTVQLTVPNKAPVLAAIADQKASANQQTSVNISATDDPGDVITLAVTGLPSFASFIDNGNGSGTIQISPNSSQLGFYGNIVVSATDNGGASSSKTFSITVADGNVSTVYINFNQVSPAPLPWNNFNAAPTIANKSITNLKDDGGNNTGITVLLPETWSGVSATGYVTGDNSGLYPDNVMVSNYYYSSTTARHIRLTGLPAGKKYNLEFFASRAGVSDNRTTTYTVGAQSVSLNAAGNSNKTVKLNNLSPDANGQIEVTVTRGSGSTWMYINSLVIQAFVESDIPVAPTNLIAAGKAKDQIQLNWNDNSSNESGFEIWRSTKEKSGYSLLTTVPANTSSYVNSGLAKGSVFFYKVRALTATQNSAYTNVAGASSLVYTVDINFNTDNPEAAPWNNTSVLPYEGFALNNLRNDENLLTGINMTLVRNFTGTNPNGINTKANTGVYPDNVMRSSWYVDHGDTAVIRLSGLSATMFYDFTFFGSRSGTGNRIANYQIGNQITSLNASNNSTNTTKISKVAADETGSVYIRVYIDDATIYGYLGALVIDGYNSTDSTVVNSLQAKKNMMAGVTDNSNAVQAYPNPFTDDILISLDIKQETPKLNVVVTDISGNKVFIKEFKNVPKGIFEQRIGINGKSLKNGIYTVEVLGVPGEKPKVVKVMK